MTKTAIITLARDCYATMAPDAEMETAMRRYRKAHNIPNGWVGLFENLVWNIDARGDHHSDERLMAWATGDPRANEASFW
jgi:hypothetical protein